MVMLMLLGGVGVAGAIIVAGGRGQRRRRAARKFLSVRPGSDGFWIGTLLSPGTRVRWSAWLDGGLQTGEIEATGGPLFVYTGHSPRNVEASVIAPAGRSSGSSGSPGSARRSGTSSGATDDWSQQDAQAQAMMAAVVHQATHRHHGALLTGFVVKWAGEAERARQIFGAPVHVVPNGVELGPEPAPRASGERLVIGTAARLARQNGWKIGLPSGM